MLGVSGTLAVQSQYLNLRFAALIQRFLNLWSKVHALNEVYSVTTNDGLCISRHFDGQEYLADILEEIQGSAMKEVPLLPTAYAVSRLSAACS